VRADGATPVSGLTRDGVDDLRRRLGALVERGDVPGLVALVASGSDVHVEVAGHVSLGDPAPLRRDAIFRIASLSKPIGAAGAMALVDDGLLSLDDPVENHLPELSDRRVLRSLESGLGDTVAAERSITVEDLLTFRLGFGALMVPPGTYPIQDAEAELQLATLGPPWPPSPFDSDEWIRRFATLPLMDQPGTVWRYNTGIQVLGVLLERVTGQPLEQFLRARLLEPLGMGDTSFSVPVEKQARLTTAYFPDAESGALTVLDPPSGGWWNEAPSAPNLAGMLVSTLDDFWAFVAMLLAGGLHGTERVLSEGSVAAMTHDHLTKAQREPARQFLGRGGWGFGMAAPRPLTSEPPVPWGFGWDGGTGTTWRSDPVRGLTGILFTQRAMTSPEPPPHFATFWEAAYAAREP
jgi:CubicO group peptidase (beta-lactamase class C family)